MSQFSILLRRSAFIIFVPKYPSRRNNRPTQGDWAGRVQELSFCDLQ